MGTRFVGWGMAVPDKIVTNDDLSKTLDTSDEWISERTGIRQRHIGGTTTELGALAGRRAMEDAKVGPEDIDFVLLATTTPDRMAPSTAALIQAELGLTCPALDVNAACAGFPYAVRVAQGLIETGTKRILLIGAETLSRWVDWTDRNVAVLLADGAGATVLEYSDTDNDILSFVLGASGVDADLLTCDHGSYFFLDGKEVFRRAVRVVVDSASEAIKKAGLEAKDISLMIPHQANIRIIQAASERLGIPMENAVITLDRYGNTSSASIPMAFWHARDEGRVKKGEYALMTGFGAGMTWASSALKWSM